MASFTRTMVLGQGNNPLTLHDLIQSLNDITRMHSDALGLGTDYHLAHDLAWVVTRYHVIIKTPFEAGEVSVSTEPFSFKRMMGYRVYELRRDGQLLVEGSVQYMLINLKTKAPVYPTDEMIERFNARYTDGRTLSFPKHKFHEPNKIKQWMYTVLKSDIDANGHVNNAAYFKAIEGPYVSECQSLSVTYKEEVFLGDEVIITHYRVDGGLWVVMEKDSRVVFECFIQ